MHNSRIHKIACAILSITSLSLMFSACEDSDECKSIYGRNDPECQKDNSNNEDGDVNKAKEFKGIDKKSDSKNCGKSGNVCPVGCKQSECSSDAGAYISFGKYNGKPIHWLILKNDSANHKIMIVSVEILDEKPFNTTSTCAWCHTTIRSWLNGYGSDKNEPQIDYAAENFFSSAFNEEERSRIIQSDLDFSDSLRTQYHEQDLYECSDETISDRIFFLSRDETQSLLRAGDDMCQRIHCTSSWMLRDREIENPYAGGWYPLCSYAEDGDRIDFCPENGRNSVKLGVRPAMWISY